MIICKKAGSWPTDYYKGSLSGNLFCYFSAFFFVVILGLDPSIQAYFAILLTWILRSSRRMTKEGGEDVRVKPEHDGRGRTLGASPRVTEKGMGQART